MAAQTVRVFVLLMTYAEKLKDPRWQKKRLKIMQRDKFECWYCGDKESTLHVHHEEYIGDNPWDTPNKHLLTLCEDCHEVEHLLKTREEKLLAVAARVLIRKDIEKIKKFNGFVREYF